MRIRTPLATLALFAAAAVAQAAPRPISEAKVGERHAEVRLPTIDRVETIALSDYRGKKVLLIEFASW